MNNRIYQPEPEHDIEEKLKPRPVRTLGSLQRRAANDPTELLRTGYLCRGGGLLLVGPTGIGKSSLAMQCAILWAIGKPCFDITPTRPLRSLMIQAENDDGDMAEMRDGVMAGLELEPDEIEMAKDSILILSEDCRNGEDFLSGTVKPALVAHEPDLVWIDPALAYLGGESNSQKDVGTFLRNGINPLIHEYNCGVVIVHHTNKPPTGQEKANWQAGDFAYAGAGSAEWANWARAVLAVQSVGSPTIFKLHAGKRGGRLGWKEQNGLTPTREKFVAHAKEPGVICWRDADMNETPAKAGRPKVYGAKDMLELLPACGMENKEWQDAAKTELGISERSYFRFRKELEDEKEIQKSNHTKNWIRATKTQKTAKMPK